MALVGEWKLTGGTYTDTSGNGYNLTKVGTIASATGFLGTAATAASATGTTGNTLYVANNSNISGLSAFSIAFRIKPANFTATGVVLVKAQTTNGLEYAITIGTGGVLVFKLSTSGTAFALNLSDASAITAGNWYTFVVEYDGTTASIFRTDMATATATSTAVSGALYNGTGNLHFFANSNSTYPNVCVCSLDDIQFYNHALTESERWSYLYAGEDFTSVRGIRAVTNTESDTFTNILTNQAITVTSRSEAESFTNIVQRPGQIVVDSRSETESFSNVSFIRSGFIIVDSRVETESFTSVNPYVSKVVVSSRSETESFTGVLFNIAYKVTVATRTEADIFTGIATSSTGYTHRITWRLIYAGVPITGASASTELRWERNADGYLYDWADSTFKSSGWTTLVTSFDEINPTNLPGAYGKIISVYQLTGTYTLYPKYTGAIAALNKYAAPIELIITDGVIQNIYAATAPSVQNIRQEMDNNSTKLAIIPSIPSAATNALLNSQVSSSLTLIQSQRVMNAILFGKVSGAGSGVETFRNPEDTKNVCTITTDPNGNRSLVVLDVT